MNKNDISVLGLNYLIYTGLLELLDPVTQRSLDKARVERFKKFATLDSIIQKEIEDNAPIIEQTLMSYMAEIEDKIYYAMEHRLNESTEV